MDPNTNQPIINQQQPAPAPQSPVESAAQGVQYQNPNTNKGHKTFLILIVLLTLVVGLTSYLIFVNLKNKTPQNIPAANVQVVPPTPTLTPTPTPAEEDLTIEDPEVDIKAVDDSAAAL